MKTCYFNIVFFLLLHIPFLSMSAQKMVWEISPKNYVKIHKSAFTKRKIVATGPIKFVKIEKAKEQSIHSLSLDFYSSPKTVNLSTKIAVIDSSSQLVNKKLAEKPEKVNDTLIQKKQKAEVHKSEDAKGKYKFPNIQVVDGSIHFIDQNKNNAIDAYEESEIRFAIRNTGNANAHNLQIMIKETMGISGVKCAPVNNIQLLQINEIKTISVKLTGTMHLNQSKAKFQISVDEGQGFGTEPFIVEVNTNEPDEPLVKIVDYHVSSQGGNRIRKKIPFQFQVLVQNIKYGIASDVQISLEIPENMYCLTANLNSSLGQLISGQSKIIEYDFIVNAKYQDKIIPLAMTATYGKEKYLSDTLINLYLDQEIKSKKLVIQSVDKNVDNHIEIESLTSDIDKDIPESQYSNQHRIALIIGNEDYSDNLNAEINVDFALNDAKTVKQYVNMALGVAEENTFYLENATAAEMRKNIDLVCKLSTKIGAQSEIIFYYAGHGLPDEQTRTPYLIPVDIDATNLDEAIELSSVYQKLGNAPACKITVFIDACFSGGGRDAGLLSARAVKIRPKLQQLHGNIVVFSASSDVQVALPYKKQNHGMFTYFLLKKIKESSGKVTYEELSRYIKRKVSIESLRINNKEQDPEIIVSPSISTQWRNWSFVE